MALILEQVDPRHPDVPLRRVHIAAQGLTIGRGLENDLIVDDPFVDVAHARIITEEDGGVLLVDLGSVNGIDALGQGRTRGLVLAPGVSFRLGRSLFRVRTADESLPPAVPLPAAVGAPGLWLEDRRWTVALLLAAVGLAGLDTWVDSVDRDAAVETLLLSASVLLLLLLWSAAWALIGRLLVRRPAFGVHLAVASATSLTGALLSWLGGWGKFLLPSMWRLPNAIEAAALVVMTVIALVAHLAYATLLKPRTRWTAVLSVVAAVATLVGAVEYLGRDRFSDVPSFSGEIRALPANLIPAGTIAEFNRSTSAAQQRADAMAEAAARRRAAQR